MAENNKKMEEAQRKLVSIIILFAIAINEY